MEPVALYARTPLERLLMEQALTMAQQLEAAGNAAPDGQVLNRLETLAVERGREFTRQALEGALQRQVEDVGSSRVDLQACKLEYSIVSPK